MSGHHWVAATHVAESRQLSLIINGPLRVAICVNKPCYSPVGDLLPLLSKMAKFRQVKIFLVILQCVSVAQSVVLKKKKSSNRCMAYADANTPGRATNTIVIMSKHF